MIRKWKTFYGKLVPPDKRDPQRGWTFVETLVVIGMVLIMTSSVGIMAFRYLDRAKVASARNQVETYSLALTSFYIDNKRFPNPKEGLQALWESPQELTDSWKGPYLNKPVSQDPWGQDYQYRQPGPEGLPYALFSYGADGREGGSGNDRDITSWEN